MSVQGFQDFWVTGSRGLFERDPDGSTTYPIIDFGTLSDAVPASFGITEATLYDSDGGTMTIVDQERVKADETYSLPIKNMRLDNLAVMFSSTPPQTFTQTTTPLVAVPHTVPTNGVGGLLKLYDASGNRMYNLASIGAVTGGGGTPTYVLNTDYQVVSLSRGLLRIMSTGSIAAGTILIGMTPAAITGARLVQPLSRNSIVRGTLSLFWGQEGNTLQTVREAYVSISPGKMSTPANNFSDVEFKVTVLNQPQNTPTNGRLLRFLGALPVQS